MSDEIFLGNKTYVSSKRAAKACGYAQDYVGQLARGGLIDAQRVGGLWYVSMESLEAYKRNAETYAPKPPESAAAPRDLDTIVTFDGKDYISAAKAAKLTGYNPDYVGQLARGGKVLSRQVGNRWYVERSGLMAHKSQKDALLAAVQTEAVGLQLPPKTLTPPPQIHAPYLTYIRESDDLLPTLTKPTPLLATETGADSAHAIPIRVSRVAPIQGKPRANAATERGSRRALSRNLAVKSAVALTVVIVMSYGFSTLKSGSLYALLPSGQQGGAVGAQISMSASAASALTAVGDALETLVAPEITYTRGK